MAIKQDRQLGRGGFLEIRVELVIDRLNPLVQFVVLLNPYP
jgi:hypothetical protein